jgi:hypothetical protein
VEFKRNVYRKALDELQVAYNKAMELLRNRNLSQDRF